MPFNRIIPKSDLEPFLPTSAQQIQDGDAIAFLNHLQRHPVTVSDLVTGAPPVTVPTAVMATGKPTPADAAPLILLPGFDSSALEFRHLIPYLAPHKTLYAIDVLGFGFTASPPSIAIAPSTIRQHLYATWQQLINRPVVLLGASLGGAIAIDFALRHPDCVERLILVDSVGFSGSFPLGQYLDNSLLNWGADWLRFRKSMAFQTAAMLPFTSSSQTDKILCAMLHQAMPGWRQAVVSFTQSGGYGYLAQQIAAIQQPTLILWGDRDSTLGTEDAWKFQRAIAHSRLMWITGADHAPHVDAPEAVAEAILQELDEESM
ncbi:MAG: alpha/beta hydrolase [Cyanobacteria bacterium P01_C01_bin.120]